ncbi:ankyrin repeat domain-containing protein, partial [Stenotrophomonas maltophilia]
MTDASRPRVLSIAFAVGAVLALGAAVGGIPGAILAALAQPAFALGVSWWRRSRALLPLKVVARQDLPALLALWAAAPLLLALLLAWPLAALRDSGSLAAVLGLSVLVSAGLLAAWRTWPLWNDVERLDGSLAQHWQALAGRDLTAWRGLGVAALVIALAALVVLPAWPDLLPESARWPATLAVLVLSPLLHLLLQRVAPAPLVSLRASPLAPASSEHEPMFSTAVETTPLEAMAPQELTPALYEAARHGRIDRGLQLLQAGADPYALPDPNWRDQRSLAVLAAVLPDLRLLRELIGRGVDVNAPHRGMTPLLAATRDSWHGRPEAVMTLLANGADSRATDSDGNTPLHHAARSSDPGVAALLRDAAAEVDALNSDGWSPLAVACQVGNWRLARFLLERGARSEPAEGTPVLLAAAATEDDDPAGVQLLLKHKARADARDRQRRSALHEAALAGHVEIIGVLLGAGANLEARDALGRTPWLEAARAGRAG